MHKVSRSFLSLLQSYTNFHEQCRVHVFADVFIAFITCYVVSTALACIHFLSVNEGIPRTCSERRR